MLNKSTIALIINLLLIGLTSCTSLSHQLTNEKLTEKSANQEQINVQSSDFNQRSSNEPQINEQFNDQQFKNQEPNQRCDDARLKCAFRLDCGQALSSYMIHCADLIASSIKNECPSKCFKALIALASTEQGAKFVDCDCGNSPFCKLSKERVEICRDKVEHEIADTTVVSCSTAKFICSSNTQCLTALTYYNDFCRSMFKGKFCSKRCLNSLNILQRQRAAYKLRNCICDGTEDFPCEKIRQNTESLCLKKANLNSTTDTSIELLTRNEDHRPLKHHHLRHRHHKISHHHHFHKFNNDFEYRRFKKHFRNRQSADFAESVNSETEIEFSPMDLDQIKKNVYFDIMMSEALLSSGNKITISSSYLMIYILLFLNSGHFIYNQIYRF